MTDTLRIQINTPEFIDCDSEEISLNIISKIIGDLVLLSSKKVSNDNNTRLLHVKAVLKDIHI